MGYWFCDDIISSVAEFVFGSANDRILFLLICRRFYEIGSTMPIWFPVIYRHDTDARIVRNLAVKSLPKPFDVKVLGRFVGLRRLEIDTTMCKGTLPTLQHLTYFYMGKDGSIRIHSLPNIKELVVSNGQTIIDQGAIDTVEELVMCDNRIKFDVSVLPKLRCFKGSTSVCPTYPAGPVTELILYGTCQLTFPEQSILTVFRGDRVVNMPTYSTLRRIYLFEFMATSIPDLPNLEILYIIHPVYPITFGTYVKLVEFRCRHASIQRMPTAPYLRRLYLYEIREAPKFTYPNLEHIEAETGTYNN